MGLAAERQKVRRITQEMLVKEQMIRQEASEHAKVSSYGGWVNVYVKSRVRITSLSMIIILVDIPALNAT